MKFLFLLLFILPALGFSKDLKILTWNIFMIPKPINFTYQIDRADQIAKTLRSFDHDVIFLQEAFSVAGQKLIAQLTKSSFPYQVMLDRGPNLLHLLNSGVFVISRYPFKILDKIHYDSCTTTDCFATKGAILIELILPNNKKVQLASTHMQAWNTEESQLVRKNQLTQVKQMLDEHAYEGIPQILVGDLNINAYKGTEYQNALALMGMTSAPITGPLNYTNGYLTDCYDTPTENKQQEWLDHIWLKQRSSTAKVVDQKVKPIFGKIEDKNCPLSDHHALEARVSL